MKNSIGFLTLLGLAVAGCGGGGQYVVLNDGALAREALASSDVNETFCPVRGGTYSRGETPVTDRMERMARPVVLENLTPPQQWRSNDGEPWTTKAPIAVRVGTEPVDIAVMDSGDATVRLAYEDWSAQKSVDAAYQRIRFMPCKGDPAEPTWYGWPGAILSDTENVCLKLAVREGDGDISVHQVPLGDACPAGVD